MWTITDRDSPADLADEARRPPLSPGEMLRDHFMADMGLSRDDVARAMGVACERVQAILDDQAPVTGEDSVRLGHAFGMSDGFWLRLQNHYDVELARTRLQGELDRLPVLVAA